MGRVDNCRASTSTIRLAIGKFSFRVSFVELMSDEFCSFFQGHSQFDRHAKQQATAQKPLGCCYPINAMNVCASEDGTSDDSGVEWSGDNRSRGPWCDLPRVETHSCHSYWINCRVFVC